MTLTTSTITAMNEAAAKMDEALGKAQVLALKLVVLGDDGIEHTVQRQPNGGWLVDADLIHVPLKQVWG